VTFFSWLGVIMYLTSEAATSTLKFVASTPHGGGVVFDYSVPRGSLNFLQKIAFDRLTARVEKAGEPFRLFFDPMELAASLRAMGFRAIEDLGSDQINARYFAGRSDGLKIGGGLARLMSAGL
jgi:O-methyltransferase involved in polyketide biosynthesis